MCVYTSFSDSQGGFIVNATAGNICLSVDNSQPFFMQQKQTVELCPPSYIHWTQVQIQMTRVAMVTIKHESALCTRQCMAPLHGHDTMSCAAGQARVKQEKGSEASQPQLTLQQQLALANLTLIGDDAIKFWLKDRSLVAVVLRVLPNEERPAEFMIPQEQFRAAMATHWGQGRRSHDLHLC